MKNDYVLQNEFNNWLMSLSDQLCLKPSFYTSQIQKIAIFNNEKECFFNVLENEILCDNHDGVEELLLNVLAKMEQSGIEKELDINIRALDGLRIGILKYRLFLHNFLVLRGIKYQSVYATVNHLWETKSIQLETFFNGNMRYSLPVYGDNYTYNKYKIDELWELVLSVNAINQGGLIDEPIHLESIFEPIVVKPREQNQLEVVDGGNTLILLSLLLHALYEFSESKYNSDPIERNMENLSRLLLINTQLNDQKLFRVLMHNSINKKATTPNEISKGIVYKCEELGLNLGFHFLQTTFRFVELIQASKIPQSEHYIENIEKFKNNVLENCYIKRKLLDKKNTNKTYLNGSTILLQNIMSWL